MRDLIAEMKSKDTGNAVAKRGAEAWAKATDEARVWFNSKGGNVGRLDDWGFPQHHSQARVAQAGRDAWVADVYPLLDHGRYTDAAGRPANENQIKELLAEKPKARGLAVPGLPLGAPGREFSSPTCETACTMLDKDSTAAPRVRREFYETLLVLKDGKTKIYARH